MKSLVQGSQLVVLVLIAALFFLAFQQEIRDGLNFFSEGAKNDSEAETWNAGADKARLADMRRLMEEPLRNAFKFPESVKFQSVTFRYTPVLQAAGLEVSDIGQELEFAEMCGLYTAKNGLGAYGQLEPFYAQVAVDNREKAITGEVMFESDAEVRVLSNLDSKVALDGNPEAFKGHWKRLCGDADTMNLGMFQGYEVGYGAYGVADVAVNLDQFTSEPSFRAYLSQCTQDQHPLSSCLWYFNCFSSAGSDNEYCQVARKICSPDDTAKQCEAKEVAFREKH